MFRLIDLAKAIQLQASRVLFHIGSPSSKRTSGPQIPSVATLSESQNKFLVAILGEIPRTELQLELEKACAWYIGYLEFKIRESWTKLFRDMLKGVNPITDDPCNQDLSAAFEVLKIIVEEIARERIALTDLVDTLYNEKLLEDTDDERSNAKQLVFIVFGWITGFDPEAKALQIINPLEGDSTNNKKPAKRRASRRRIKTFAIYEQPLESNDHLDQPLYTLLGSFGKIIPQRNRQSSITGHSTPLLALPARPDEHWIELSLLCFHTLEKVAFIKVEWVDSLSLHLEFDRSTKVLKLFRLPSLCLIMSSCDKLSPLSRIFWDADDGNNFLRAEVEDASEFYKEVLLSYRLIFGQESNSHRDFSITSQSYTPLSKDLEYHDSLLPILCGQDWESATARPIYEMIDAEDPSTQYSPAADFPYLGKRLLEIQRYVRGHKPNDFWALWYDKRDHAAWWAFWAVILIGGITVVITTLLGVLQLAVGILQAQYAREQLGQQTQQVMPPGG
ncbi:hypothetical protein BDZ45DRAFT_684279 [Acephala macrosclerotiorum]|nr:hypothetical protein BDZ45DRAFT_684279 [Acephala macrosclerotiorum]